MKRLIIILLVVFVGSVIGLFLIYTYPEIYRNYLNALFWSTSGTSLGIILGTYKKNKNDVQVSKSVFMRVVLVCLISLSISIIMFLIFKEKSFVSILTINIIGLIVSIVMLIKGQKNADNSKN
ncbi:MAG: hypothetical protein RBT19_14425 [Tenuifilaceae bacterium]|jgi:small basic protein|nr:hypothetical protein [Tenuifilaceae bacterium]